jgi:hypothetical protein
MSSSFEKYELHAEQLPGKNALCLPTAILFFSIVINNLVIYNTE